MATNFDLIGGLNQAGPTDLNTSKGFVMSGLNDWLNNAFGAVNQKYAGAGWGGSIHAPSVYNASAKPIIQTGANMARTAMTDLYQKDRAFNEQQRQFDLLRKDRMYAGSEASNAQKVANDTADKWYNWM